MVTTTYVRAAAASLMAMFSMGCRTNGPPSRSEVVGSYEYHLENLKNRWLGTTCFTLHDDGTFIAGNADLSSADGPKLPAAGRWILSANDRGPLLDLEHNGFPLERHQASLRALVNNDLGYFCELDK